MTEMTTMESGVPWCLRHKVSHHVTGQAPRRQSELLIERTPIPKFTDGVLH